MFERRDSFTILRDTMRWRVALVLGVLIIVLMVALGTLNTSLGLADTATLARVVLAGSGGAVAALIVLPRRLGGTVFFLVTAAILVAIPAYGWVHGRSMAHWAYIFPPLVVFVLRAGPSLAAMIAYGIYSGVVTALLLEPIEVVRLSSGYGLLVCFMYTYALLQERAAAMLRYHSEHDALSNCLNRRTFNDALEQLVRGRTARCAFLLIDIDHFKSINDRHGHLVGDRVITQVAAELGRTLDPGTPLFRYGGEEFAVLVADAGEPHAVAIAERLRAAIAGASFQGVPATISIGVAEWRRGETVDAALGRADRALYEAKRLGRNRVVARAPAAHVA